MHGNLYAQGEQTRAKGVHWLVLPWGLRQGDLASGTKETWHQGGRTSDSAHKNLRGGLGGITIACQLQN